jgi:hypothetical protein
MASIGRCISTPAAMAKQAPQKIGARSPTMDARAAPLA